MALVRASLAIPRQRCVESVLDDCLIGTTPSSSYRSSSKAGWLGNANQKSSSGLEVLGAHKQQRLRRSEVNVSATSSTPSGQMASCTEKRNVGAQASRGRFAESRHEAKDDSGSAADLGRRQALFAGLTCAIVSLSPRDAMAGGLFDKYIKRKKLDPLDTYLPTILLSQLQIEEIDGKLVAEEPKYDDARSLLRSGPASSLRSDIRAVAQYAADAGDGQTAVEAVDGCLRAIEELDSYLLRATRNDPPALDVMRQRVTKALNSLDSLLSTVPPEILEKGKAVAFAYRDLDITQTPSAQQNVEPNLLKALPSGL